MKNIILFQPGNRHKVKRCKKILKEPKTEDIPRRSRVLQRRENRNDGNHYREQQVRKLDHKDI